MTRILLTLRSEFLNNSVVVCYSGHIFEEKLDNTIQRPLQFSNLCRLVLTFEYLLITFDPKLSKNYHKVSQLLISIIVSTTYFPNL